MASLSRAGVVVDSSFAGASAGPRSGNIAIPSRLGLQVGSNLFQSFSQFNLAAGESITFSGPSNVANVVARVTGGPATVNGTIGSDIPGANLILIDPAGISFGTHASLQLSGGSFVASTASYVKLADGTKFAASLGAADSMLTTAAPSAFGFLSKPAPLTFIGNVSDNPGGFAAPEGRAVSFVAGDMQIVGGKLLAQSHGAINLVSIGAAGEVALDTNDPASQPAASPTITTGAMSLSGGANVAAPEGGRITIRAGTLQLTQSSVAVNNSFIGGGYVDVGVSGALSLQDAHIGADTAGAVSAGAVRLSADSIFAQGLYSGGGAAISSDTHGPGEGGQISINTGSLSLSQNAFVSAFSGPATILNSSRTRPNVDAAGAPLLFGNGASITINASRQITLDGTGAANLTGIAAETVSPQLGGRGGDVQIQAASLTMRNTAEITSTTKGSGDAGNITIDADNITIDGGHLASTLTGVQARVGEGAQDLGATGQGGQVRILAHDLTLRYGGVITATTFGQGNGGSIDVRSQNISLRGAPRSNPMLPPSDTTGQTLFTGFFARAQPGAAAGAGTGGNGGSINVVAQHEIRASGDARFSAIGTNGSNAGNVSVHAGRIRLSTGSSASVAAEGARGGLVDLEARESMRLSRAYISSMAGTGGDAALAAGQLLEITGSKITARATSTTAKGGKITLDPPIVVLSDSVIDGRSAGARVPVTVAADAAFLRSQTVILSGAITVPPEADIAGSIEVLVTPVFTALPLTPQCGAHFAGDEFSSFLVTDRGGQPALPTGWIPELRLAP